MSRDISIVLVRGSTSCFTPVVLVRGSSSYFLQLITTTAVRVHRPWSRVRHSHIVSQGSPSDWRKCSASTGGTCFRDLKSQEKGHVEQHVDCTCHGQTGRSCEASKRSRVQTTFQPQAHTHTLSQKGSVERRRLPHWAPQPILVL